MVGILITSNGKAEVQTYEFILYRPRADTENNWASAIPGRLNPQDPDQLVHKQIVLSTATNI